MGLKDKINGLRIVRACWSRTDENDILNDNDYCNRVGCPYAGPECIEQVLMDAVDVVEKLHKKLKKAKKKGGTPTA